MDSKLMTVAGAPARGKPSSPPTLLCVAPRDMEDEPDESYSFMSCLAPSSSSVHEPILSKATAATIPNSAASVSSTTSTTTTKMLLEEDGESPQYAASLANLTDLTVGEEEGELDKRDNLHEQLAYQAGLMASGLAWVRWQKRNRLGTGRLSPAYNQEVIQRAASKDSEPLPYTPTRPTRSPPRDEILEIKLCPTSPSFMTQVADSQLFSLAKIPLASNSIINNTNATTTSRSVASSPAKTTLVPRFDPVNSVYSISSLLTGRTPNQEDSQNNIISYQNQQLVSYPPSPIPVVVDSQEAAAAISTFPSLGYFCQDESQPSKKGANKSPGRSALARVFSTIGSEFTDDDEEVSGDGDDAESLLEHDDSDEDIHGVAWIPRVRCVAESPARVCNSCILSPQQMHQIARHVLPKGIATCQWNRIYSLARDGDSFDVCLHYARNDSKTLLVVRTTRGALFGGYAGETWTKSGDAHYYGNNEACLFTFEKQKLEASAEEGLTEVKMHQGSNEPSNTNATPQDRTSPTPLISERKAENLSDAKGLRTPKRPSTECPSTPGSAYNSPNSPPLVQRPKKSLVDDDFEDDEYNYVANLPPIRVYRYQGVNRYIQLCDANRKMMAFGGGGNKGSFGLCIEREFQVGSTGHCDTFDNEPLCTQQNFKILDLEIWGFLTGQF